MPNRILALLLVLLVGLPSHVFAGSQHYDAVRGQLPNVAMVRKVVGGLGVSRKVEVQTTHSRKLRATITAIDEGSFTVAHGAFATSMVVAYDEVVQLKSASLLPRRAKVAITVVAAVFVTALVSMAICTGCGH